MILKRYPEDFIVDEVINPKHVKNDCLVFTLKKTNWNTFYALKAIARQLGVSGRRFGYAGLKDKRGITTQKVSISGILKKKLEEVSLTGVEISEVERGDKINLGDHLGNRFSIKVRDIIRTHEEMDVRLEEMKNGFSNYFGSQRFGEIRPISSEVGREIVKGDFERAGMIFLAKPFKVERFYEVRKNLWETHDFETAFKEFPKSLGFERRMLYVLNRGGDFTEAFKALPLRLTMLFVHAFQGEIFNKILERRKREVPLHTPEIGDMISTSKFQRKAYVFCNKKNIEKIRKKSFPIVAPIVGYKTICKGRMRDILDEILLKEGVSRGDFYIPSLPKLSSRGTYRELLGTFSDFSYELEKDSIKMNIFLSKGEYATVFLEEFFQEKPTYEYILKEM
ncbi:MAG: tRNA pseudouridine(13) synthase TruD [Candidatus Methanofastidiosia archaeon]